MDTKVTPPDVDPPEPGEDQDDLDEAMPRVQITRRRLILGVFFVVSTVAFLYVVLPNLADLENTRERIGDGLVVTGWADLDDLPEALEVTDNRFALGVQWHPEADERSRLIATLVEEARARRNGAG